MSTVSRQAPYLRATFLGTSRNADLVLPSDQPVASLVPQLLQILDEPVGEVGRLAIVTETGEVLDPEERIGSLGLSDGVRLRVVSSREVPPAPAVYDMVEAVEAVTPVGQWSPSTRAWVLATIGASVIGLATWLGARDLDSGATAGFLACVALLAYVISAMVSATQDKALPWVLAALGAVTSVAAVRALDVSTATRSAAWAAVAGLVVAAVGWCAHQLWVSITGAGTLAVLGATAGITWQLTDNVVETGGVTLVVALMLLGLLPRLALGQSGVFGFDSRVTGGERLSQRAADASVAEAHWILLSGVVLTSGVFAAASWAAGRHSDLQPWPTGLVILAALGFALRGRHFPLAIERGVIWLASTAGPLGLLVAVTDDRPELSWAFAGGLAVLAVLIMCGSLINISSHQAAQARRLASRVESLAIMLTIPVLVGVFGVYEDLLKTF